MTKEKMITLLNKMYRNSMDCAEIFRKDKNEFMETSLVAEAVAYSTVVAMLANEETFKSYWNIYFKEGN